MSDNIAELATQSYSLQHWCPFKPLFLAGKEVNDFLQFDEKVE